VVGHDADLSIARRHSREIGYLHRKKASDSPGFGRPVHVKSVAGRPGAREASHEQEEH
jgi:hypothetical protein